jgi:hypothetical protein
MPDPANQAVQQFLLRTTLPILVQETGQYGVMGCGALYRDERGSFLITAQHVATEVLSTTRLLGVPVGPSPSRVLTLGKGVMASAPNEDVAVLRLDQPELVDALDSGGQFRFLDRSNLAVDFEAAGFMLYGYPAANSGMKADDSETFSSRGVFIEGSHYDGACDAVSNVTLGPHDLLFEWKDRDANLRGISGSPIWAITPGPVGVAGIWSVERYLRMVAVQTGVARGVWIRGTTVRVALQAMERVAQYPKRT